MTTALPHGDTTRNATLADMVDLLRDQHGRVTDYVVPATAMRSHGGNIHVAGAGEPELTLEGVTARDVILRPTSVFDEGMADKLGIPLRYLQRLRQERPDLYDLNVNGWLHGSADGAPRDPRRFMLRSFRGEDGDEGVARALLSDTYKVIDNLDVLMTVLSGVRDAGIAVDVRSCDLSDRRMYVKINAPGVTALAPVLLGGYRSPFGDVDVDKARQHGRIAQGTQQIGMAGNAPIVSAGLRISNSEVGGGAFTITPEVTVLVCTNGMLVTKDAMRNVHLGGKLETGVIRWSDKTQKVNLDLIKAKTTDAVSTFLDSDYVAQVVADIEAKAGDKLERPATDTVEVVGKNLGWTEGEQAGILDHFIRGGQMTKGGVLNAVTSYSQVISDPDRADELDSSALRVLELA